MENRKHSLLVVTGQNTSIIEDTYLLAALLTFDPNITYKPRRESNGKVSFEVNGKISTEMGKLYAGETAPLQTYIRNLKALRSKIFALRSQTGS